jgi:hypothetical protein
MFETLIDWEKQASDMRKLTDARVDRDLFRKLENTRRMVELRVKFDAIKLKDWGKASVEATTCID